MEDHCKGGWHAQAAEFPSIHRIGGGGCDACAGADRDIGARTGERRNEQRRIDPGLFPHLASPVLSLVRAAGIRSRPGDQQVALAAAARGRFGFASSPSSGRGRGKRLRPAGRRLYQSDFAALGSGGREKDSAKCRSQASSTGTLPTNVGPCQCRSSTSNSRCRSFSSRTRS